MMKRRAKGTGRQGRETTTKAPPAQKPKMGRPLKFGARSRQLAIYVPEAVFEALRRFSAIEEGEGRKRPTNSEIVVRALREWEPLARFVTEKGLDFPQ